MSCVSTFGRDNAAVNKDVENRKYIVANAVLLGAVSYLEDQIIVSGDRIMALEEKNGELTHDLEIYEREERIHKRYDRLLQIQCDKLRHECGFLKFVLVAVTGLLILNIAGFL